MKILITGASGLIGTALSKRLIVDGHKIGAMLRNTTHPPCWDIEKQLIDFGDFKDADVVIHLAGENIASGRWTEAKKDRILQSRLKSTRLLVKSFAGLQKKPKLLISGSAIGFYGNSGQLIVDETSAAGKNFSSRLCQQWEEASHPAKEMGIRLVNIRTGIVLSSSSGALKKMLLPFKLGLGGIIGDGKQYMSWVSIKDIVAMLRYIIANDTLKGCVNLVSQQPVSNRQFTKILGRVLKRPTLLPMPALVVRGIFGEMADELLLSSTRVLPRKLLSAKYPFIHDSLEPALRAILR